MKSCLLVLVFLTGYYLHAQPLKKSDKLVDTLVETLFVRYDPEVLRIPGKTLPIGLTTILKNGKVQQTKGYLDGKLRWNNFKIRVIGGEYAFGKIRITGDDSYKKSKYIEVNVYSRKTKKLIRVQRIPYNYEKDIRILYNDNFAKAPGNRIDFGIRTFYDNDMYTDFWPRSTNALITGYDVNTSGGSIFSGDFYIATNPFDIHYHTVKINTQLLKCRAVQDTLSIVLDYIDNYRADLYGSSGLDGFNGTSGYSGSSGENGGDGTNGEDGDYGDRGPDLHVYADVYYDTIIDQQLMYLQITNLENKHEYNYLINTKGGSIKIVSRGGDGGSGGSGGSGGFGGGGQDGEWHTYTKKINDSTTMEIKIQGPGNNGGNGGYGGSGGYGGNGGDGGDIYLQYTSYAAPYIGRISILSLPGSGGNGGSGGSGGLGGSGGTGNPSGNNGINGVSGYSGADGEDGYPGRVYPELVPDEPTANNSETK